LIQKHINNYVKKTVKQAWMSRRSKTLESNSWLHELFRHWIKTNTQSGMNSLPSTSTKQRKWAWQYIKHILMHSTNVYAIRHCRKLFLSYFSRNKKLIVYRFLTISSPLSNFHLPCNFLIICIIITTGRGWSTATSWPRVLFLSVHLTFVV
jgi:hypothetical protein